MQGWLFRREGRDGPMIRITERKRVRRKRTLIVAMKMAQKNSNNRRELPSRFTEFDNLLFLNYAGLLIKKYSTKTKKARKRKEKKMLRKTVCLLRADNFLKAAFIRGFLDSWIIG